jgi:hypothetical protein
MRAHNVGHRHQAAPGEGWARSRREAANERGRRPAPVYYLPRPVPEADLAIMRRLDGLHLEFPFAGSRMLRGLLAAEGCNRPPSCEDADGADGDRGALSPSADDQAGARPQDLPVSASSALD